MILFPNPPQLIDFSSQRMLKSSRRPLIISNSFFRPFSHIQKLITRTERLFTPKVVEETVAREKKQKLLDIFFHLLEQFICTSTASSLNPSIDPKHVLSGFFFPVDEFPPTPCEVVQGTLPKSLDGVYIRNGPNPQFTPQGSYHVFDGDGMLHIVKIYQGQASFCSRYVKTYKYKIEGKMGYSFFPSVFSSFYGGLGATFARFMITSVRVVFGQFNPVINGFGTANTNLALFAGNLFALCESDLPYTIKVTSDGDIATLGRHDFQSVDPFHRMTAHPKVDTITGEAFAYRYNITHPYLTFFRINSKGRKQPDVHIHSMNKLTVIHDFAITKNYAIFPDMQIVVNPAEILRGLSPVKVDHTKVPRLGIIPRYAEDESEMLWIDVPGFNMMHAINSWEEDGGNIVVIVGSNILSIDQILTNIQLAGLSLEKVVVNIKENTVQRLALSSKNLDLGVINPVYASKRNRYVYAAIIDPSGTISGAVKLDLSLSSTGHEDGFTVGIRMYGPGCCGGEPFYVARDPNNAICEEDDGYLMTFVHNENTQESSYIVMDAKSSTLDIIAIVNLPTRVPCGFHGLFIKKDDIDKLHDSDW